MSTPNRMIIYGLSVAAVFGIAFFIGKALIPEDTVADWTRQAKADSDEHESMEAGHEAAHVGGLSIEEDGYTLSPIKAPGSAGQRGELSFRVLGAGGAPVTEYETNHERQLHLITVRSDGDEFEHVHPRLDAATGTWSMPWTWPTGGTYRVYADFLPGTSDDEQGLTLSRGVEVAGNFEPAKKPLSRADEVDGFEVSLAGQLEPGATSALTARISRAGKPVDDLEPYLGAFGHLVALREGDLGYLHVHAEDDDAGAKRSGPEIDFAAEAPTAGRYLLYLDFKVDGRVHTAEFVLEAK